MEDQLKINYIAHSIDDYYVIVSDEKVKDGDFMYTPFKGYVTKYEAIKGCNLDPAWKKVHYQSKQIYEGVTVIDCPWIEDVKKLALNIYPELLWNRVFNRELPYIDLNKEEKVGFIEGYSKAKEKYKYTEQDVEKAYLAGLMNEAIDPHKEYQEFIQELRKPKSYSVKIERIIYPFNQISLEVKPKVEYKITKWTEIRY